MLFDLVLRNGPTIYQWDGNCASDILSAVEDLNPNIRVNLKLKGYHNEKLLSQLSTFGVKVIDAYGVCISGTNWDKVSHINDVIHGTTPDDNIQFIDGSFLKKKHTNYGSFYEVEMESFIFRFVNNGNKWEWFRFNNEGNISESGESGALITAVRQARASLQPS